MSQRFQCQLVLCNATLAAQAHAIPWIWTRQEDTDMSIDTLEAIYIGQVGIFWKNNFPSTFCFSPTAEALGSSAIVKVSEQTGAAPKPIPPRFQSQGSQVKVPK